MTPQGRKLLIALVLFLLGVVIYLAQSGAPWRVHAVEIPLQFLLLMTTAALTWRPGLRLSFRLLLFGLLVITGSLVRTWLLSTVVMSLYPLEPELFATATFAIAVELLLFVLIIWTIDAGLNIALRKINLTTRRD